MEARDAASSGLTAGNTASHIHCCIAPGGNAGVATTTPTFTGFPSGVTSGSYDHVFDLTSLSSYNPAFVTANGGLVSSAEAVLLMGLSDGQGHPHNTLPTFRVAKSGALPPGLSQPPLGR